MFGTAFVDELSKLALSPQTIANAAQGRFTQAVTAATPAARNARFASGQRMAAVASRRNIDAWRAHVPARPFPVAKSDFGTPAPAPFRAANPHGMLPAHPPSSYASLYAHNR